MAGAARRLDHRGRRRLQRLDLRGPQDPPGPADVAAGHGRRRHLRRPPPAQQPDASRPPRPRPPDRPRRRPADGAGPARPVTLGWPPGSSCNAGLWSLNKGNSA